MTGRMRHGFRMDRDKMKAARLIGKGWRQSDLAAAAGITKGEVCRIEKGVHIAQLRTASKLAKALDVALNDLLIWESDLQARFEDRKAS